MLLQNRKSLKNRAAIFATLVLILGGLVLAQGSRNQKGPRALGVLEVLPSGRARLVPVSILVDGKWYDAGLYKADPLPMALEPGTVYEGEKTGASQGLFTIASAQQVGAQWFGLGSWKPNESESESAAKEKDKKPATKPPVDSEDQPPVLHRGSGPQVATTAPPSPTPLPPKSEGGSGSADKGSTPVPPKAQSASQSASDDDTNRPILRRGQPKREQAEDLNWPSATPATTGKPGEPVASEIVKTYAAISDAGGPGPKSYSMMLRPDERRNYEETLGRFAVNAIKSFAVSHRIGARGGASLNMTGIVMRAFDVNLSNEPVLVYEARAIETPGTPGQKPPSRTAATRVPAQKKAATTAPSSQPGSDSQAAPIGAFQYYVTVVARVGVNGEVRKLFDQVTDTGHLDAYPRLSLVDCVDADGNGVGELLFRQTYDRSRDYVLYRVGMDRLWQLFESTGAPFVAGQ